MAKRRTKKDKLAASLKRQHQFVLSETSLASIIPNSTPERLSVKSNIGVSKEKLLLLKASLTKTVMLSLFILGIEIALYLYFKTSS